MHPYLKKCYLFRFWSPRKRKQRLTLLLMRRRLLDHSRRRHPRRRVAHKPHRNLCLHQHREVNSLHPQGGHLLRFLGTGILTFLSMNMNKEAMTSVAAIYDFAIKIHSLRFRGPPPPHPPPPGGALRQPPPPGVRRPLPPRPRPRPRPRPARPASGGSILGSVSKSVANLGGKIKCAAEDLYADQQLADKQYIRQQLDCVLSRGPCDENGNLIRSECARKGEGTWIWTLITDQFLLQEWRQIFCEASVRGLVTSARGTRSAKRWP